MRPAGAADILSLLQRGNDHKVASALGLSYKSHREQRNSDKSEAFPFGIPVDGSHRAIESGLSDAGAISKGLASIAVRSSGKISRQFRETDYTIL